MFGVMLHTWTPWFHTVYICVVKLSHHSVNNIVLQTQVAKQVQLLSSLKIKMWYRMTGK